MLRALRAARIGKTALWITSLFAIAGSFGLHPEPRFLSSAVLCSRIEWTAPVATREQADGCAACLAHRAVALTGLSNAVREPDSVVRCSFFAHARTEVVDLSPNDGRAPPARS